VRPHTVRRPRLALGDGAATRVKRLAPGLCMRQGRVRYVYVSFPYSHRIEVRVFWITRDYDHSQKLRNKALTLAHAQTIHYTRD